MGDKGEEMRKKPITKAEIVYKKAIDAAWAIYDKDAAKAREKQLKAAAVALDVLDKARVEEGK